MEFSTQVTAHCIGIDADPALMRSLKAREELLEAAMAKPGQKVTSVDALHVSEISTDAIGIVFARSTILHTEETTHGKSERPHAARVVWFCYNRTQRGPQISIVTRLGSISLILETDEWVIVPKIAAETEAPETETK